MTATVDKAGRIVIPKPVREELGLESGDTLEIETSSEAITLRPVRESVPLKKERGVWVYRTGKSLPPPLVDKFIWEMRKERDRQVVALPL